MLGPILGPSWARLCPMLGHLGAKFGPIWVVLSASWAMLGQVGALLEGPGRHPEADSGLGGTVLEPTCGKKATCQKHQNTIEKHRFFHRFFGGWGLRGSVLSWSVRGHGRHLVANKAAKSQDHPFLGPSWALLGPILGPSWPYVEASWATCGVEVVFVC